MAPLKPNKESHDVLVVSASAAPKDVVGAIVTSGTPPAKGVIGSREDPFVFRFKLMFAFILIFAVVVWFREEIYAATKDIHKHPILANTENWQIRQWLGTSWKFASGDKPELDDDPVAPASATPASTFNPAPSTRRRWMF